MFNALMDQYLINQINLLPITGSCCQTMPFYDPNQSRLEICAIEPSSNAKQSRMSIDGLSTKTNMTLKFLAMDYELTPDFAHVLGFSGARHLLPFVVVVDLQNEQKYIMKSNARRLNIGKILSKLIINWHW